MDNSMNDSMNDSIDNSMNDSMDNSIDVSMDNSMDKKKKHNYNIFQIDPEDKVNDFIMYGKYDNVNWEHMNLQQLVKFRSFLAKGINNMKNKNYGKKNYGNKYDEKNKHSFTK